MNKFNLKTELYFGENALDRLKEIIDQKVFIVTDPFMVKSGMINNVTDRLDENNIEYKIFSDIVPDPPVETIIQGIKVMSEIDTDIIIALGGGSSIDAAKAIKEFSKKILEYKEREFIAIPTTSGTGSEVTSFSVITDKSKNTKYPLIDDGLIPQEAILDPELVKSVPNFITADTGIDVLTHAIEAYVSTNANDFSDALAEKAVQLVFEYLLKAYEDGNDMEAREKMHNASCMAGIAFNSVSLGLNHGIAHVLGAKFHIPHGRANSILLPHIIEYNADLKGFSQKEYNLAAKKYANLAKLLSLPSSNIRIGVRSLINAINKLQKNINISLNLRSCDVEFEKLQEFKEEIIEAALKDRCTETNPRIPNKEEIGKIIEEIY